MSATHVDDVDAFSRTLYRRARTAGPAFSDIASVVRSLHTVLKHLKVEIEDPASLLGSGSSSVYARQLTPLVEDCDFALQQLEVVLDKSGTETGTGESEALGGKAMPGEKGWVLETGERDRLELIRAKLATQKLNIDMFLDTVQLRNTTRRREVATADTSHVDMDSIKDKVDAIATRICHFKDSDSADDDEELWQKFRDELIREGFSKDILRQNQDVLRAYIRQLDEQALSHDGNMPSVRGFLENYNPADDPGLQLAPYEEYPAPSELSANAMYHSPRPEYTHKAAADDTQSLDRYKPAALREQQSALSYEYYSSDNEDMDPANAMAVMSTRDLMAIDRRSNDLAIAHANRGLPAPNEPYLSGMDHHPVGSPPSTRYVPPSATLPVLLPPPASDHGGDLVGSDCRSPPPLLHGNSVSAPLLGAEDGGLPRATRLAPDSQGNDIPLEAKWTRIKRSLVSIEVLAQRGLRFEARPTFVAVLGALSREKVEELARRSAEVREARRAHQTNDGAMNGAAKPRRAEDRYYPDKYRNWDIETPKDPNHHGYTINPSGRRKNSHASEMSELYDTSDEDSESDYGYTDEEDHYPPPPRHKPQPYHHNQEDLRARGDSVVSNGSAGSDQTKEDDDKGTKSYPFIVSAPREESKKTSNGEGASPAATVQPKPILKNKGEPTHVRFDTEPQVLDDSMSSPSRSLPRRSDRTHGSGREKSYHSDRYLDRERDRERDRDRDRDRDRARDREHGSDRYDQRHRDRDEYHRDEHESRSSHRRRERGESLSSSAPSSYSRKKDSSSRRRTRNGALSAAGIGGAAASLLAVLTEAAAAL
ncbi:uncharacterized protein B0I36DRAFT_371698 [Microdochium trichocladiopsis]|uniref:DUF8035 domain-containing protein n=1 Tax=Microdochium trichocladiopsis TaxID=1682393 RepID=A0A9P9BXE9_9PEZI|nr:uncharacterized protein B0I36DRAFT_371698 [Microdochium trichocladiopsis]KAH7041535.1 hypothetical protein B0I36DRAFT_371698 [Microdochium trichocladiopsis]